MNLTLSDFRCIRELILSRVQRIKTTVDTPGMPDFQRTAAEDTLQEWEERLARFDEDLQEAYAVRLTSKMEQQMAAEREEKKDD